MKKKSIIGLHWLKNHWIWYIINIQVHHQIFLKFSPSQKHDASNCYLHHIFETKIFLSFFFLFNKKMFEKDYYHKQDVIGRGNSIKIAGKKADNTFTLIGKPLNLIYNKYRRIIKYFLRISSLQKHDASNCYLHNIFQTIKYFFSCFFI